MSLVALSNLVSLSIYAIGSYVLWKLHPLAAVLYLVYCAYLEFRILRHSCSNCHYYGKVCCFGKGRVCSFFFQRGDPKRFVERKISWLDILPDFLVTIVPVVIGAALLIHDFSWIVLAAIVLLLILGFVGSAVIRGAFACKHCAQKDLGCPAVELFEKST